MPDPLQQFRVAMASRGITPPTDIIADGQLHRCDAEGRNGKGDASYVVHLDGAPAGGFENWRDGLGWQNWKADIGRSLTPSEMASHRAKVEAARRQQQVDAAKRHAEARTRAESIWTQAASASGHPYLARKNVAPHGTRIFKQRLVIPLRDAIGDLRSLQFIEEDGTKRFLPGGQVRGSHFMIGESAGTICIAEGFATGASIHEATGYAVAVAFDAGNLKPVAQALRIKQPDVRLIICGDDDHFTDTNPGRTKAHEAAQAVGGLVAFPDFGTTRPDGATDFNDMAAHCGLEAVKRTVQAASVVSDPLGGQDDQNVRIPPSGESAWPVPQSLESRIDGVPYPVDALPDSIREAVEEVAGFVKAPLPLVAASALSAISLAVQAHVDVLRAEKLVGPVGIYLLTVANSGERKSTCDSFFSRAIRDYQDAQIEAAKPLMQANRADAEIWEAKHAGIKDKIRQAAKNGKPTADLEATLRDLEIDRPEPPRIPRLVYVDATPEALAFGLARTWPSAGLVSAEAGLVLGAHGMGRESVMRNLALLNQLWDGTSVAIDRRTSESFTVNGARLTVGLQIQEATLRSFFEKSGVLARGSGFLARFLVALPESTQGKRPFSDPPEHWPHLAVFNRRVTAILEQPATLAEDGSLTPTVLTMHPAAKHAWVDFHDQIEGELSSGGELHDVRDVASKAADNVARLAALFHVFDSTNSSNSSSNISVAQIDAARRIIAWHLNESRRFFGELALPPDLADAAKLDSWLVRYCHERKTAFIPKNVVRQSGPMRDKSRLDAAIGELADLDRIRLRKEGKRSFIELNPALLASTP